MNKKSKEYKALLNRMVDIFNGATGQGLTADGWLDEYASADVISRIMSVVDDLFTAQLKKQIYQSFELLPFHVRYFDQPETATEFLFEFGVRA